MLTGCLPHQEPSLPILPKSYSKEFIPLEKSLVVTSQKKAVFLASLQEMYRAILKRKGSSAELTTHLNNLTQGATLEGIYEGLSLGNEHYQLEKKSSQVSTKTYHYFQNFFKQYLNKKIPESWQQMKQFQFRRKILDQILGIIDGFLIENRKEDLFMWYALLSQKWAEEFTWKNRLRQQQAYKSHQQWAQQVPIDYLKYELIIKTSLICRHLSKS